MPVVTIPDPLQQMVALFAGIGVVLVVASTIGLALKVSVAQGQPHGEIDNLNARIKAWWVMVLVVGCALLVGRAGVTLLFLFASGVALREFVSVTCAPSITQRGVTVVCAVVLLLQYLLVYVGWFGAFAIFVPVCAFLFLPIVIMAVGDVQRASAFAARMQWGLMICVYGISHVPALLMLDIPGYDGRSVLLIVFLILVVQASDVLQYVWGKLCGRRKLAPVVSPSKTWEGLVGGIASATALGAAIHWITPFLAWQAALIALAITTSGFIGGLALSAIKRESGAKDWGRMIEGHGGMLDRLDSVAFAAPVFFYLIRLGWA